MSQNKKMMTAKEWFTRNDNDVPGWILERLESYHTYSLSFKKEQIDEAIKLVDDILKQHRILEIEIDETQLLKQLLTKIKEGL